MPRYIVLTTEEKTSRQRALPPPTSSSQKRFQDWAVGDVIARKSNRHDKLQITHVGGSGKMTYGIRVQVVNVASGDTREMGSSTLQTAFEHDPSDDAPAQAVLPKDGTPNAFNVDLIRNFYPRKGGRKGTRIMTCNGVAYAVLEEFEVVLAMARDEVKIEDTDAEA